MAHPDPELVDGGAVLAQAGLVHRVVRPDGPGPHPTVLMLHGRSGSEDVMWIFARAVPKNWLLVAPRAIETDPAGGYSWRIREQDDWPALAQFDKPVQALLRFIDTLPELYGADLDRLYLMGFSQGAAAAYALAMNHPQRVQAIAGLVGFVPMECGDLATAASLDGIPIFMAVGREDERIPYDRSLNCAQTLNLAGADLAYHEYDTGHRLNRDGMRDLEAWWAEQAARGLHQQPERRESHQ